MKKLNLPLNNISAQLGRYAAKYSHMLIFIIFSALASTLMFRIGQFSRNEPTEIQLKEKVSKVTSAKIDEESLAKLEELQDRNVSIESLFNNGRTNPFEN